MTWGCQYERLHLKGGPRLCLDYRTGLGRIVAAFQKENETNGKLKTLDFCVSDHWKCPGGVIVRAPPKGRNQ